MPSMARVGLSAPAGCNRGASSATIGMGVSVQVRLLDQDLARWRRFAGLPHQFHLLLLQARLAPPFPAAHLSTNVQATSSMGLLRRLRPLAPSARLRLGAAQSWFARLLQHCRHSSPRSLIGLRGRCRLPTSCLALPVGRHDGASGRAPSRRTRSSAATVERRTVVHAHLATVQQDSSVVCHPGARRVRSLPSRSQHTTCGTASAPARGFAFPTLGLSARGFSSPGAGFFLFSRLASHTSMRTSDPFAPALPSRSRSAHVALHFAVLQSSPAPVSLPKLCSLDLNHAR